MRQSKAIAGGLAGAVTLLVMYLLNQIPAISTMPDGPAGALEFLVASGVGYAMVYFAPKNT